MEVFGSFLDEEWESLGKMFSSEDSDFLLHFNEENLFPNQVGDQSVLFTSDAFDQTNFYCVSQESCNSSDIEGALSTNPVDENGVSFLHNVMSNAFEPTDFCTGNIDGLMVPELPHDHVVEENPGIDQTAETGNFYEEIALKRKYETPEIHASSDQSPNKNPRVSGDNGQKNKRNSKSKKNKKAEIQNDCSSEEEDDSNASESNNLASNGKTKANRGFATDPQSLYARRRRERINERLRILQNLVPSGTKVDISTMLEEAVHYVKFLQLQIKLLSSDELWMYAPIAFNGTDIGLYQKINIPNQ